MENRARIGFELDEGSIPLGRCIFSGIKPSSTSRQLVTSLISKVTVSPGSDSTAWPWLLPTVVEEVTPYGVAGQLFAV